MGVPWGQAAQVGGVGFGMVFMLLVILAVVIWLVGFVVIKTSASKSQADTKKKGD